MDYCNLIWCPSSIKTKPNRINIPYHLTRLYEVADYLESNNIPVKCFDMEMTNTEYSDLITFSIINNCKCFVFYTTTENIFNVVKYAEMIKTINKDAKILVYGELSSICPEFFLDYQIDAISSEYSDFEIAIESFYNYYCLNKKNLIGVHELVNKKIRFAKKNKWLDPKLWGFPEEKHFKFQDVLNSGRIDQMTITITRGCCFNCDFCITKKTEGQEYRKRPISQIVQYIKNHKYKIYKFFSAFFTLDKNYVMLLCDELIKLNKKIKWSCCTRADYLQDEELIKKMKLAGCYKISVGVETFSQTSLNFVHKKLEIDSIIKALNLLQKYKIQFKALLMFGMPNQTIEEIRLTLDILTKFPNVVLRPLVYTNFFNIERGMSLTEILKYDKWTNYNYHIKGLEYDNFFKLVYDVNNYNKYI